MGVFALFRPRKGTKNPVSLGGNAPVFFLRARFAGFLGGAAPRAPTVLCSRAVLWRVLASPRPRLVPLAALRGRSAGAPRAAPRGSFFFRKIGGKKKEGMLRIPWPPFGRNARTPGPRSLFVRRGPPVRSILVRRGPSVRSILVRRGPSVRSVFARGGPSVRSVFARGGPSVRPAPCFGRVLLGGLRQPFGKAPPAPSEEDPLSSTIREEGWKGPARIGYCAARRVPAATAIPSTLGHLRGAPSSSSLRPLAFRLRRTLKSHFFECRSAVPAQLVHLQGQRSVRYASELTFFSFPPSRPSLRSKNHIIPFYPHTQFSFPPQVPHIFPTHYAIYPHKIPYPIFSMPLIRTPSECIHGLPTSRPVLIAMSYCLCGEAVVK